MFISRKLSTPMTDVAVPLSVTVDTPAATNPAAQVSGSMRTQTRGSRSIDAIYLVVRDSQIYLLEYFALVVLSGIIPAYRN